MWAQGRWRDIQRGGRRNDEHSRLHREAVTVRKQRESRKEEEEEEGLDGLSVTLAFQIHLTHSTLETNYYATATVSPFFPNKCLIKDRAKFDYAKCTL